MVDVVNAAVSDTLKWLILGHVNFAPVKKKNLCSRPMFDGRWKFFAFQTWMVYVGVTSQYGFLGSTLRDSGLIIREEAWTQSFMKAVQGIPAPRTFPSISTRLASLPACRSAEAPPGQLDRLTLAELHCNCVLRVWPCIWTCECGSQWKARFIYEHVKKYTRLQGYEICVYNGKWGWPAMELNPVLPWSFRISYASQCQNATVSPGRQGV